MTTKSIIIDKETVTHVDKILCLLEKNGFFCYKTPLVIHCYHCGTIIGVKEGGGVTGVSSGLCPQCAQGEMEKYRLTNTL